MSTTPAKPRPTIGPDNAAFWTAIARHRLALPFCTDCHRTHLPAGPVCPFCLSTALEWREATGRGVLASWTVVHKPLVAAFRADLPYAIAMVELEEGPRLISSLIDADLANLRIGLAVEIVYDDLDADLTLHRFRLVEDDGP